MSGKQIKLKISSAGTAATPLLEVEMQGDMTINPGKSMDATAFKNGSVSAVGKTPWTATLSIGERNPMPTAQALLWTHHNDETPVYIEASGVVGSVMWAGTVKVVITEDNSPVSGVRIYNVTLSEDGVIAQSIKA